MQALQVAALHKLSGVLGIMALTWATVVLLGGFVSDLSTWDFYLISVLLLVESFRLFIIQIFIKLVSRIFYRENRDPAEFKFNDEQPELVSRLNFLAQASSGGIAFVCLLVTFYRISIRGSSPFSSDNCSKHVVASLWIFYMIVILNFIIAILSAALHLFFRQRQRNNDMFQGGKLANSLTTFYDTIYRTAVEHGITEGGEVDLLDFAFDKIASDLRRNIRPLLVRDLNREMIIYMYENNGVVMACQYLKGDDLWKRIAAANLPGFWCQERKVDTKQELFWSLSDRVFGGGADADASLNSIESLARCWSRERDGRPHPFLVGISGRGNVLDTIVDLVLMETRSPLHFRVRAFEACCRDPRVREYLYRQVDPHSDQPVDATQICIYLYELIYKEVHGQERQERGKIIVKGVHGQERGKIAECCAKISKSNLARLCIKLAVVLTSEGKNVRIVASIYSASALMLLLQPCDNTRPLPAAEKLQEWIKARFIVEQPKEARRHSYYTKADLEAAEKVLVWLNLPELEWTSPSVKVRDMENGMQVLSSDEIKRIISDIRGSTARTTPRTLEHYHSEWLA
ncbi:hypothetical protein KP509_18G025000 [Ceratopteris richardii]|nr:hypothetical protein KP509_18G025000 [Ceratopteris richardii]